MILKTISENIKDFYTNRKGLLKKLHKMQTGLNFSESMFLSTEPNRKARINKKSRGSRFRGVSKNGSKFQVIIMINKSKRFVGVLEAEEDAARLYDKLAIVFHGNKVNFNSLNPSFRLKQTSITL